MSFKTHAFHRLAALFMSVLILVGAISTRAQAQDNSANDAIDSAKPVATGGTGSFQIPWDAAPDPDGKIFYFTSASQNGPGVFSVSANGGPVSVVTVGAPLVNPLGLAVGSDGKLLYVADPWSAGSNGNALFAVSAAGGKSMLVNGTAGTAPRGVEVANESGADQLYFTGLDPASSQPAVLKIAAFGGTAPTIIAKGSPLVDPSGIVAAKDGSLYILDRLAAGEGLGAVFQVRGGTVTKLIDKVLVGGQYAGLALTLDNSVLIVSSLAMDKKTAQVILVNLATKKASVANKDIGSNLAAGGIHRAAKVNVFAWADCTSGGPVYRVIPRG